MMVSRKVFYSASLAGIVLFGLWFWWIGAKRMEEAGSTYPVYALLMNVLSDLADENDNIIHRGYVNINDLREAKTINYIRTYHSLDNEGYLMDTWGSRIKIIETDFVVSAISKGSDGVLYSSDDVVRRWLK
jgi:hypothetical protein